MGPTLVGWLNGLTHNFTIAFSLLAVFGMAGGGLVIAVRDARRAPAVASVAAQ